MLWSNLLQNTSVWPTLFFSVKTVKLTKDMVKIVITLLNIHDNNDNKQPWITPNPLKDLYIISIRKVVLKTRYFGQMDTQTLNS